MRKRTPTKGKHGEKSEIGHRSTRNKCSHCTTDEIEERIVARESGISISDGHDRRSSKPAEQQMEKCQGAVFQRHVVDERSEVIFYLRGILQHLKQQRMGLLQLKGTPAGCSFCTKSMLQEPTMLSPPVVIRQGPSVELPAVPMKIKTVMQSGKSRMEYIQHQRRE